MKIEAFFLDRTGEPLSRRELAIDTVGTSEVIVEVEACGLCHTDLSFAGGSVSPRHPLPLVLGHEITGLVVSAGEDAAHLMNRPVLVPAVLPCGECELCAAGRGNACPRQKMPGNDIHGGFASHVLLPAAALIPIDDAPENINRANLSVVADAVSTAYQAIMRSGLGAGDAVVVVGAGGVGGFTIQFAGAMGARVIACDVSEERLRSAAAYGAEHTLNVGELDPREARGKIRELIGSWGVPSLRHRIFESSGTSAGQLLAYSLLARAATMVQVGYTFEKVTVRLSNLMAFDATIHGSWGCPPDAYPQVLKMIYDGSVAVDPFVEQVPMSELNRRLDDMAHHRLTKRMVLMADA